MTDSVALHEPRDSLDPSSIDKHRAYRSLMEELEAIDWYSQRIEAADDAQLKSILTHNRNEEMEHAAMLLEWLRRQEPVLDGYLREHLFSKGTIREAEDEQPSSRDTGDLEIRSLRGSTR